MISVKVLADSQNVETGHRITTFLLTYPRFIHSEVMTNRVIAKNSASSRAIPIRKVISNILKCPALPVEWGANGKGMQAKGQIPKHRQVLAKGVWIFASWLSCLCSWLLSRLGVHKQLANRITEPWAHMTVVATATDYENMFALRCHPDAQPEYQVLAYKMLAAYRRSQPKLLKAGEWHLPFAEGLDLSEQDALVVSTARCARTSYVNFDGNHSLEKDLALHDDLKARGHMSPFDHPARAMSAEEVRDDTSNGKKLQAHLNGFVPYRKLIPNETRRLTAAEMDTLLIEYYEDRDEHECE